MLFKYISVKAATLGAIAALLLGAMYQSDDFHHMLGSHNHSHENIEVHYHSDMALFINGEQIDLTADKYMSGSNQILAESVHLHDNNDDVIHFHDNGITLVDFFASLGIALTNDCIVLDTDESYCSDSESNLSITNNSKLVSDITTFVPNDEDRILIYYGDNKAMNDLTPYQEKITTDACIYSLTCPEKGTPPPESCGLTCEI